MTIGPDRGPGHPLLGRADLAGRVVTAMDPDGYVLVDGLLVRAALSAGRAMTGDFVTLEFDRAGRLVAFPEPAEPAEPAEPSPGRR